MTDNSTKAKVEKGLARRRRKEFIFRGAGMLATTVGVLFLGVFFLTLFQNGSSAFQQSFVLVDFEFSEDILAPDGELDLEYANFDAIPRNALRAKFPNVTSRSERRELNRLLSVSAGYMARDIIEADPELLGETVPVWVPAASTKTNR